MGLFNLNKKKEDTSNCKTAPIKVLGSGCAKCNQLEAAAKEALEQLGMDTGIDHAALTGKNNSHKFFLKNAFFRRV